MATQTRPHGSPLISNKGLPKIDASIGMPGGSAQGSTCTGHQMPRPSDAAINSFFKSNFVPGAVINQNLVNTLRQKIQLELEKRLAHASYSTGTISSLRNSLNANPIARGQVANANLSGKLANDSIQSIEGAGSPSNVLRGAAPLYEQVGSIGTPNHPANQLNLNTAPYNSDPSNYTGGAKTGQHSPPYSQERDRSGGFPINVNIAISNKMFASDYLNLINNYESLVRDCICHSDCNCNAVCACHNNCGCNY